MSYPLSQTRPRSCKDRQRKLCAMHKTWFPGTRKAAKYVDRSQVLPIAHAVLERMRRALGIIPYD